MCPRGRPRGQGRPRGLHLCDSKHLSNVSEEATATSFLQASLQSPSPKRPTKKAIARPTATALSP